MITLKWVIYSLTDPRDNRVRYVGKTTDAKKRLCEHVRESLYSRSRSHRLNWIRDVIESGQMPQVSILEEGDGDWVSAEKKWIKNFRDAGYDLVNATDGGEGCENPSLETRAKRSAALKGHIVSPETRAKIGDSRRGLKVSAEVRSKMSAASKGRVKSPQTRARMSVAQKARAVELRAQASLANKIRWQSPENRAKQSAAAKAAWAVRKAKTS